MTEKTKPQEIALKSPAKKLLLEQTPEIPKSRLKSFIGWYKKSDYEALKAAAIEVIDTVDNKYTKKIKQLNN